jgi:hypothetical protein
VEGRGGEGRNECIHADRAGARADASVLPPGNFITDATVRPSHGRYSASKSRTSQRPSSDRPSVRPSFRYRPRDNPVS